MKPLAGLPLPQQRDEHPSNTAQNHNNKEVFHVEHRRMDYHVHSTHSFDASQSIQDICRTMAAQGVEEFSLTEHIDPGHPDPVVDVTPIWDVWLNEIQQARKNWPQLTIKAGIEIGDWPSLRPQIQTMLDTVPLDFRLLSLHCVDGVDIYWPEYWQGRSRNENYRRYGEALADTLTHWEDFDSVAHIGFCAKFSPYKGAEQPFRYEDAPDALDVVLRRIIALDKCMEINTSGYNKIGSLLPDPSIVKRYVELGGTLFTFGSDSHDVDRDYANIDRARAEVAALGGKYQCSFTQRKRTEWLL